MPTWRRRPAADRCGDLGGVTIVCSMLSQLQRLRTRLRHCLVPRHASHPCCGRQSSLLAGLGCMLHNTQLAASARAPAGPSAAAHACKPACTACTPRTLDALRYIMQAPTDARRV
jgi:hypothetical protein